jgi:hypothetical protein
MLRFIRTPARNGQPRATANHATRVQSVHGRNCICHCCKPTKERGGTPKAAYTNDRRGLPLPTNLMPWSS